MTMSWRRWTQPETTISKNVSSGGTEHLPEVYRGPRSNCWTLRYAMSVERTAVLGGLLYLYCASACI
jgi:hypothetical protein